MPINPEIILRAGQGVAPITQPDPYERHAKILGIKSAMGAQEMQGMQLQQARQGVADEAATRQAIMDAGGDNERAMALLNQRGLYKPAQAFEKNSLDRRKALAGIGKDEAAAAASQHTVAIDQIQRGSSILASATPQNWGAVRNLLTMEYPKLAGQLPEQFDPQFIQAKIAQGQTVTQRLAAQAKEAELAQTRANAPFTSGPNGPVANEPVQAFQLDKAKKGATNVSVKTDVKMGEGLAKEVGPMMRDSTIAAEGAVKQAQAAQSIVQAVDSGKIITGPAAEGRLVASQVAQLIGAGGKDDAEKIANTRQALRGLAELTLQGRQQMRGQGAITESEGKLAEKAMSGEISFTAAEIKQLAKASERAARFQHAEHSRKLKVMQDNPNLQQVAPFYQGPAMPGEIPSPPPRGTVAPAGGGIKFLGMEPG